MFHELFPDAVRHDADVVDRVAEGEPFSNLEELEHAGEWLVRLAASPDALLRARMLTRWRQACRRSAVLGPGAYRLYQHLAPRFCAGSVGGDRALRSVCAARLRWDSPLDRALRRVRQATRRTT
jgi:hypothetical protein